MQKVTSSIFWASAYWSLRASAGPRIRVEALWPGLPERLPPHGGRILTSRPAVIVCPRGLSCAACVTTHMASAARVHATSCGLPCITTARSLRSPQRANRLTGPPFLAQRHIRYHHPNQLKVLLPRHAAICPISFLGLSMACAMTPLGLRCQTRHTAFAGQARAGGLCLTVAPHC